MKSRDLQPYCDHLLESGATHVKVVLPGRVVTAPWVRLKCQFGCSGYDCSYCCPPHTPTDDQTRRILDTYRRALLIHIETAATRDRERILKHCRSRLIDLEGILFKDGFYRAFIFLSGPCNVCSRCGTQTGRPCQDRIRLRPSMEGCGIDVFQTARDHGFHIEPLKTQAEPRNHFSLMLVD
jgi:predicted metal-binding protein